MTFYTTKPFLFPLIWCCFLICNLSSGSPTRESISPSNGEQDFEMFQQWMMEHGRNYSNTEEENTRYEIFQNNLIIITETNARRSNSPSGHRLGLNKFSDMSPEEFRKVYLRQLPVTTSIAQTTSRTGFLQQKESCEGAPSSKDWSKKGVVTPVKNQLRCGSVWAFSATGAIESAHAIATGKLIRLSEQELVDCDSNSMGCSGGLPTSAFHWVIKNGGISKEDDYRYEGQQGSCKANTENVAVKIESYELVEQSDSALLCAVAERPISVGLDATHLQFYQGGIVDDQSCPTGSRPNHAALIIGYDSKEGTDYWIVKNSWGEDWGVSGYFMVRRNANSSNGVCSINTSASYPIIQTSAPVTNPIVTCLFDGVTIRSLP